MIMDNPDAWGDTKSVLGIDQHATWRKSDHNKLRDELYRYWIDKGWETIE